MQPVSFSFFVHNMVNVDHKIRDIVRDGIFTTTLVTDEEPGACRLSGASVAEGPGASNTS